MKRLWDKIKALYEPKPMTPAQAFERLKQELPAETVCVQQEYWQNMQGSKSDSRIEYRVSLFKGDTLSVQKYGTDLALVVESALLDYRL